MTRPPGTWMIYHHDYYAHLDSVQPDLETATAAVEDWQKVGWLPYGVDLQVAVKAWEAGEYKIEFKDPGPRTEQVVRESLDGWLNLAGIELDSWQASAIRYFLKDTITEEKP